MRTHTRTHTRTRAQLGTEFSYTELTKKACFEVPSAHAAPPAPNAPPHRTPPHGTHDAVPEGGSHSSGFAFSVFACSALVSIVLVC